MAEEVIIVKGVSKHFILPHEKVTSLKGHFVRGFNKKKTLETYQALNDINFTVKKGEFFGIVGRNGSGKSTLLKILAKIYQPTSGGVETYGRLVPFIELGVGFNPELTGKDNVYLNGAMLGFSRKEIDALYDEIVAFAELEEFMDQKLKNYSSGMQVRLAFSMATRSRADILLVDEVLAVGDADFQRKCFNYFKELKQKGVTVVFVTHDMGAVREYCDRVILIENSHLVLEGNANKVSTAYTRLFQGENADSIQEDKSRYGDGRAKMRKPLCKISEKDINISFIIEAVSDVNDPVFGFTIKNAAGTAILGTNTNMLRYGKIGKLTKGLTAEVAWTLPNILKDGYHSVDIAAVDADGVTIIDWWEAAAELSIKKDNSSPYLVSPDIQVSINKL